MMTLFLTTTLLFGLSAKQQMYLAQKLCPNCKTIGVIVARGERQEEVGELIKSSMYYNFTVEQENPRKASELPAAFADLVKKNVDIIWIFEDSLTQDPMAMRYIVSQSLEKKIPVVSGSAKQLSYGATFFFGTKPDNTAFVQVKKAALDALKLSLPKSDEIPIEIVE
jgi:ABC-type uncharacterized transport system substrate-binding protein